MSFYTRTLTLFIISGALLLVATNWIIDPTGWRRLQGWELSWDDKRVWSNPRLAKAVHIPKIQVDSIIVGTSRVLYGFNVNSQIIRRYLGPTYNLGVSGMSMQEMDVYVRHALHHTPPKHLLLALDLGKFNSTKRLPPIYLDDIHLPYHKQQSNKILQTLSVLWSQKTIFGSLKFFLNKDNSTALNGTGNPLFLDNRVKLKGHNQATQIVESNMKAIYDSIKHKNWFTQEVQRLDKLINQACLKGIQVTLFTNPVHARQLVLLQATKHWGSFKQWLRLLVLMQHRYAKTGCEISLTDFSQPSDWTTEPFPALGDVTTSMKWYWESSHFKPALGDLVIEQLFSPGPVEGFGVKLNADNIDQALDSYTAKLNSYYLKENPMLH